MNIQHKQSGDKGSFSMDEDGKRIALMTYSSPSDKRMVIEHTEVDDAYKGQHIGNKLVDEAVAYARENGLKIKPVCPFVKAVFEKSDQYKDVWA